MKIITGLHPHNRLGPMEGLEGARMLEQKLSILSHDVSNLKTPGFKRQRITFEEYYLRQIDNTKRTAKGEVVKNDFSQGTVRLTENPFDFAIEGEGFFAVQTPTGIKYTRAGNFTLDAQNRLVTQEGYLVLGDGGPIVLQDNTGKGVWLNENRRFYVDATDVAGLDVVTFDNLYGLKRLGGNLWEATEASGNARPLPNARVRQGYIEESNVNPLEAMIHLVDMYREYEAVQRSLKITDGLDDKATNDVGRAA